MNNTVAIVVTYNRKELLIECIEALCKSEFPCDILVVDNDSTDGTKEAVMPYVGEFDEHSQLFYENTGKNLGGAGGFSYGLRRAYEIGYSYFWMMDDDTIVQPNSLKILREADAYVGPNYGFLSGMAVWTDGTPCVMNHHTVPHDWNADKLLLDQGIVRCSMATFVSFFTRREVVEDVGLPVKEYFIWGDDTEYTNRISKKYPSYLISGSKVLHKMKSNESSENFVTMTDEARIRRTFYSIRNDLCTFRRNGFKAGLTTYLNAVVLWYKVLFRAKALKGLKLGVIWKGIWAGLFFAPKIEKVK